MRVINKQRCLYRSQSPVGCVEEGVGGCVILWAYPFAFQHTPERHCDVEMRRIWRQVEEEESPAFPHGSQLFCGVASVNACIVKHDNHVSCFRPKGQPVEKVGHQIGCYAPPRREAFVAVVSGCHSKDVEPGNFLGRDEYIFPAELPAVRLIAFGADVAFIGVEEVYSPCRCLLFKFLQLLDLVFVELRRGFSPWAFSYTLISCAKAAKKRLNADSLASLPVACCHASRALFTLWRSCSSSCLCASVNSKRVVILISNVYFSLITRTAA